MAVPDSSVENTAAVVSHVKPIVEFSYVSAVARVSNINAHADIKLILDVTSRGLIYGDTRLSDPVIMSDEVSMNIFIAIESNVLVTDLIPRYFGDLLNESPLNSYKFLADGEIPTVDQVIVTLG